MKQGPTALSMRQGHQCGYIIWEVVCNNDAQNPAAQNGGGGASGNSTSEPKISAGFQGAYLFAYATNTENRSYVCNFSYTISYDDDEDDDLRDTKSNSGQFGVPAHAINMNVLKLAGAFVNPRLEFLESFVLVNGGRKARLDRGSLFLPKDKTIFCFSLFELNLCLDRRPRLRAGKQTFAQLAENDCFPPN